MIGERYPGEKDTFRVPLCHCPHCGEKLDAASLFGKQKADRASPGDFSVCINCAAVLRFRDDLTLRATTLGEHKEADPEKLDQIMKAILFCKKMNPNWCKRTSS